MGFALKQKCVVAGADECYSNIQHTQMQHMRRSEVGNNEGLETLMNRDANWDCTEM